MASDSAPIVETDLYSDYVLATERMSVVERIAWLYDQRIGSRKDASAFVWLNSLLKTGAIGLGHIDNAMYRDLLSGNLTSTDIGRFLCEYYWGSGYGFQRIVLPATAKSAKNGTWLKYIRAIIREENTPCSHYGMLKRFIEALGFDVGHMTKSADAFNGRMLQGYGASLGLALGYALGIETEADFQIALLFVALRGPYKEQVDAMEYFRTHMSEYGEELHAQETCRSIEKLMLEGECAQSEIEVGFRQAISDTRDYMNAIQASIQASSEKTPSYNS